MTTTTFDNPYDEPDMGLDLLPEDDGDFRGIPEAHEPAPELLAFLQACHAAGYAARIVDDDEADPMDYPRGRCDTCGAACDDETGDCTRNPAHQTAIDPTALCQRSTPGCSVDHHNQNTPCETL